MDELRDKINKLLDKFIANEMLEKAYEHILFVYLHIYDKNQE